MRLGVGFRKRIAYAKTTGHLTESAILEAKYNYWKDSLSKETSIDGKTKTIVPYSQGDILRIEDYDLEHPGIFLRSAPDFRIDPNWSSIYNSYIVEILEGPIIKIDHDKKEAITFWKVQPGDRTGLDFIPSQYLPSGWISEEWFGEKVPTRGIRN